MINISEFITGVKEKYPAQLLKGRIEYEGNVISCFFKDMLLLDDTTFEQKDFITADGLFYFSLLKNLRKKGFYSLDEITILSNMNEEVIEKFEDKGGWDTIQHQIDIINTQNFDTYIDILYRENIMLNMYKDGFNLLQEITVGDKKVIPFKLFRKMTAEEVTDWYEARISSYGTGYSSKILEEEEIDFDDEFIESCKDGEENGVPFDIAGYDKNGEEHYNLISALHKSMRNSDVDAAIYWLARMLEAGEDPLYIARRLVRFASEDIGMADSRALEIAIAGYQACHFIGMPECSVHLTHVVTYLSLSVKSNALYVAYESAKKDALETISEPVPLHLRNAPTKLMKDLHYGQGYQYAHDFADKLTTMTCLPDSLLNKEYYHPTLQGHEKKVALRLQQIKKWKKEKNKA